MKTEHAWVSPALQNFHSVAFDNLSSIHRDRRPPSLEYQSLEALSHLLPALSHRMPLYPQYQQAQSTAEMDSGAAHDLSEFQRLSNDYEPDLEGPLVGQKQSTQAIVSEYAHADPAFVAKTATLAQTHSHYRIMKGDGNCGWRAVAFGYFENLFLLRDTVRVAQELARIKGFNKLLDQVGHQEDLYEIFVDATEDLLVQVSQAIAAGSYDESFLVNAFNDEYNSNAMITHFRLMTSSWMKLNPDQYQAFLSLPLDAYCATTIEPVRTEIDEVGLQALVNGVIQASGFAVEVLYLDRSDGTAVTPHILTPPENQLATIRLLYRPGHYDLLYQSAPHSTSVEVQVNYATAAETASCVTQDPSFMLPDFTNNPVLMHIPNFARGVPTSPNPSFSNVQTYAFPVYPSPPVAHRPASPPSLPMSPTHRFHSGPPLLPEPNGADRSSDLPIRINEFVYAPMHTLPLSSISYRNSHSSQAAHFQNPKFQPSMWDPSELYKSGK